jgi:glycine oxidase
VWPFRLPGAVSGAFCYNERMAEHTDILIVGGGIIGLTTAWFLASEGVSVTLIDRDDLGRQASWAGAGIISPGNPDHATSPHALFRARSCIDHAHLAVRLQAETGIDNGYCVCGGIELPEAESLVDLPTEEWHSEGIVFLPLDRAGLDRLAPGLSPTIPWGCHLPDMAQVRNPRHLKALQEAATRHGVRLLPHTSARGFLAQGERVSALVTEHGPLSAGQFLLATGAWTSEVAAQLGWQPPIRPIRGQIALLDTGQPGIRPILLQGKRYLVPRPDGLLLAGSTEEDAGFDARPTAGGVGELLAFATRLLPELSQATLVRSWAGLRPGSPDGWPFLGRLPGWHNVYVAAGHFRAGIQLSPATGRVLTDLLLGRPPSLPLDVFRPDRPLPPSSQAAFRS